MRDMITKITTIFFMSTTGSGAKRVKSTLPRGSFLSTVLIGMGFRYLILDVLGQGTFGQVVKCQNSKTNEILAVKVIKNKPAYFNQSMMEVTILQMVSTFWFYSSVYTDSVTAE
jgi:serine/threonine protein kinase